MLIAAMNYLDSGGKAFGPILVKAFKEFMVVGVKINSGINECRFDFFSPTSTNRGEPETARYLDEDISVLELKGPESKMQKALRYMFFSKKDDEMFLVEGASCALDFPWALQIAVSATMDMEFTQDVIDLIGKVDVFIQLTDGEYADSHFMKIKQINPYVDYFTQNASEEISAELQEYFMHAFTQYTSNRELVKHMLELNHPNKTIRCEQTYRLAGKLGVSVPLVGSICDEFDYRITHCRLGCF